MDNTDTFTITAPPTGRTPGTIEEIEAWDAPLERHEDDDDLAGSPGPRAVRPGA